MSQVTAQYLARLLLIPILIWGCSRDATLVHIGKTGATIENQYLKVSFGSQTGTWSLFNKELHTTIIDQAAFGVEDQLSSNEGFQFTFADVTNHTPNKTLQIYGIGDQNMDIGIQFSLSPDSPSLTVSPSAINRGTEPVRIKTLHVVSDAIFFPDAQPINLQLLDGNGGAEVTHVRNIPDLQSRNNLLITGEVDGKRTSLTMGGLSYEYFEKFASIRSVLPREEQINKMMTEEGLTPLRYYNLGSDSKSMQKLEFINAQPYAFQSNNPPEINQIVYAEEKVVLSVSGLKPGQPTVLGFSWIDDGDWRVQSVTVSDASNPDQEFKLLSDKKLPSNQKGEGAQFHLINLPAKAMGSGNLLIRFEDVNRVVNAVVSELWLAGGSLAESIQGEEIGVSYRDDIRINLWAEDPIGKRLMPREAFESFNDRFYIDAVTSDPFVSLEKYGQTLSKEQKAAPRLYTFPTVCLWYASHRHYGGEAIATNSSRGAVEEMQRIANSGFLNYSTAAVRLVPDSYYVNNEQGWWDEEHWQRYGSGQGEKSGYNVLVKAHYEPPYETTIKWAGAVTQLGGIPLIYFQTSVRSQDYADQHPDHMLFNVSNHPYTNGWPNPQLAGYDFTDPGFITHMKEVYVNLHNGGVQGLMFDYPRTGWSEVGGFDNEDVTTAWAYRNIFRLPFEGLGQQNSLVHERNLMRGSDITLGLVASQRVWGDTDNTIPEMITRCGLRWYKNRVVVSYDTDSKNLVKAWEVSRDRLRQVLTMVSVGTGRMLLGNSFGIMNDEVLHDLSRVFPSNNTPQSARPVDAFIHEQPAIYQFRINDDWSLVTLYNTDPDKAMDFDIQMDASNLNGGLQLDTNEKYHLYDFWNHKYLGVVDGNERLRQTVRVDEARMIAIHRVEDHPQFISTNRHLMQGFLDLKEVNWDPITQTLTGQANLVTGEPFRIVIATNGHQLKSCSSDTGTCHIDNISDEIIELVIQGEGWTRWVIE